MNLSHQQRLEALEELDCMAAYDIAKADSGEAIPWLQALENIDEVSVMINRQAGLGIRELLADKREFILAIAAHYGAYNVRVFGSVARGEATIASDVDFLVEMDPTRSLLDRMV